MSTKVNVTFFRSQEPQLRSDLLIGTLPATDNKRSSHGAIVKLYKGKREGILYNCNKVVFERIS